MTLRSQKKTGHACAHGFVSWHSLLLDLKNDWFELHRLDHGSSCVGSVVSCNHHPFLNICWYLRMDEFPFINRSATCKNFTVSLYVRFYSGQMMRIAIFSQSKTY